MIKAYDFKSPKKFTKERMSTVENLYDRVSVGSSRLEL